MNALSPLQLNQLLFTDVRISSQHLTDTQMQGFLQTATEFRTKADPNNNRNWQVVLRVHLQNTGQDKTTPYVGTLECVGMFTVAPEWPQEKIEQLVSINGTGLLYAAVREMVCNITSRGPWGAITLPTQSFVEAYEAGKKAREAKQVVAT